MQFLMSCQKKLYSRKQVILIFCLSCDEYTMQTVAAEVARMAEEQLNSCMRLYLYLFYTQYSQSLNDLTCVHTMQPVVQPDAPVVSCEHTPLVVVPWGHYSQTVLSFVALSLNGEVQQTVLSLYDCYQTFVPPDICPRKLPSRTSTPVRVRV